MIVVVLVIGWLGAAAVASTTAVASDADSVSDAAVVSVTVEPVSAVTAVDPAVLAAETATSIGRDARALSASTAEWATPQSREELDSTVDKLEQELNRTIPVLDSAGRVDADVAAMMDALEGVRADVVVTATHVLDLETPDADPSVREALKAAIAGQRAGTPVTRETMSALGVLMAAGAAARDSQSAYVIEQQRLAAEAAGKEAAAAEEAAAEEAADRLVTEVDSESPDAQSTPVPSPDPVTFAPFSGITVCTQRQGLFDEFPVTECSTGF